MPGKKTKPEPVKVPVKIKIDVDVKINGRLLHSFPVLIFRGMDTAEFAFNLAEQVYLRTHKLCPGPIIWGGR